MRPETRLGFVVTDRPAARCATNCEHSDHGPFQHVEQAVQLAWRAHIMDTAKPPVYPFAIDQSHDELVLRRRTGTPRVGYFWLIWLTGWTAGCVLPIWKLSQGLQPDYAVVTLI